MNRPRLAFLLGILCPLAAQSAVPGRLDPDLLRTPVYTAEGDAFVRHNGDRFNNRPLYGNQNHAIVVAGDRPFIRFGENNVLHGSFMVALVRGKKAKWLQNWSDITSKYHPGRMEWIAKDAEFGATEAILEAVTPAEGSGAALRLHIENAQPGDRLVWACGGITTQKNGMQAGYDLTTSAWTSGGARQQLMNRGFAPDECQGDAVTVGKDSFTLEMKKGQPLPATMGACSAPSKMSVADAGAWADPLQLAASTPSDKPLACGVVDLNGKPDVYWAMQTVQPKQNSVKALPPEEAFAAGKKRAVDVGNRVVVDTPDARFNAMVAVSNSVTDGVFREGMFTHSGMRWGVALLGWRCIFGGTAYGWHDRVKTEAALCIARQVTQSDKTVPKAGPQYGLSCQSLDSRMFGKGRVDANQTWHYDMQSQFFDQLIHEWRATADPELEKILRPALELHLEYIRDCYDPDGDGLYESYANTWPTDDQWYNGGGTAEETAYAYNGHQAALEMARRAGDLAAVKRHEAALAKISKNFMAKLWVKDKDYVGSYVEQGGHERLHEDCWLYAIFCPIDAGLLTTKRAAQSLYYTEWGLEREDMPYGGQRCWTSNWVPSIWSVREMWPGDNYQLALSYFQAGLADGGWNLLKGTFPAMAFYGPVPGDLGYPNGGTDFNDCASLFCRTVVEGLFGYRPDYPNGVVTVAPQLPSEWDHASIRTPDFRLAMTSSGANYQIGLTRPAALDLELPFRAKKLTGVTVNGRPAKFDVQPGYGCSIAKVRISASESQAATVELAWKHPLPAYPPVSLEMTLGQKPDLTPAGATKILQPALVPTTAGYHLAEALVQVGDSPQRRIFKIKVDDATAEAARAAQVFDKVPADARWMPVNMAASFNGDIRGLFKQKYLSPRPDTCSLRLATDGYSTWQRSLGKPFPDEGRGPKIDLTQVDALRDPKVGIRTPQGVPFAWPDEDRNVAMTSMWDNWPRQVTIPINQKGDGIWFLLCGFTNPMQGRIVNAELRLKYADGAEEKMELIPPFNFWSLCPFGGADYNYNRDAFALPKTPPATVQLGTNCRAVLLNRRLRPDVALASVTLETFSQEVMIGLMGVTILNPATK